MRHSGAVAQTHHRRALGGGAKIRQQIGVIGIRLLSHAFGFGMVDLRQRPRRRIEPTPGVATGREPRPPIADVLQTARRQKSARQVAAISRTAGLTDYPIGAFDEPRRSAAQPRVVSGETVVLGQAPENPAVMLIIAARLVAAGAIQHALFGSEIARQTDRALVVQPAVEAILRLFVITAPVEIHDHHARLVAISAIAKRADAREAAVALGLALAINQQVSGMRAVELIENRLGSH